MKPKNRRRTIIRHEVVYTPNIAVKLAIIHIKCLKHYPKWMSMANTQSELNQNQPHKENQRKQKKQKTVRHLPSTVHVNIYYTHKHSVK